MSARTDAALAVTGGILGGLAIATLIARRYLATPITGRPADPSSTTPNAVVTSITNLKGAKR